MTLYTFPDPREDVKARLNEAKPTYWPTATISTEFPTVALTAPYIQHAWDGTPSEDAVRERCTIRFTVWMPKGQRRAAIDLAALVKAVMLNAHSSAVWRYSTGSGRAPGQDDATKNEFCTFTLTADTRPSPVL